LISFTQDTEEKVSWRDTERGNMVICPVLFAKTSAS
jgi:hypothetical protein